MSDVALYYGEWTHITRRPNEEGLYLVAIEDHAIVYRQLAWYSTHTKLFRDNDTSRPLLDVEWWTGIPDAPPTKARTA